MAIPSLQLPGYAAPQSLDFTSLANLGQVYKKAAAEQGLREAFAGGVPTDAAGLSQLGARVGEYNPQLGLSLAQLGMNAGQREQDRERQARLDQRQTGRDAVDDRFREESLRLQKAAAARAADKTPANFVEDPSVPGGYRPIGPADPNYIADIARRKAEAEAATGGKNGLQPIYGTGPDGKPVILQMSPTGKAVQTQLPDGVNISRDPIRVDQGTSIMLLDPITRQPISVIPKDVAGVERAKVEGEARGKAVVSAPQDIQSASNALDAINGIRNDPYLDRSTGLMSRLNAVPGTAGYDFQNKVNQAKGGAFLTAIQQMRGLGALSEVEGKTATSAVNRMDTATSSKAFRAALDDYEKVVRQALVRAQKNGGAAPQSSSGGSVTSSGVKWSVE